jgi:signal transduction histidine kinase
MRSYAQGGAGDPDWRAEVLRRTSRLLVVFCVPTALLAMEFNRVPGRYTSDALVLVFLAVVVLVAALSSQVRSWRPLAASLVVVLVAVCLAIGARFGFGPGPGMGLLCGVVLAAVFFGGRAMWCVAVLCALAILGIGAAVHAGRLHLLDPRRMFAWTEMDTWLRVSAVFLLGTSIAASTVATLIARLERALAEEHDARAASEKARRRNEFLAEASRIFASSPDYESSLQRVAELATPLLGDCCAIRVGTSRGAVRRIVVAASSDGQGAAQLRELASFPPRQDAARGVEDPEFLRALRDRGLESQVSVTLSTRDRVHGTLTLASPAAGRDALDLATAEELGRRATAAIEVGLLFEATQRAIELREEFLAVSAHELRTPLTSLRLALQSMARRELQEHGNPGSEAWSRMLAIAERQTENLCRLADTVLEVTRTAGSPLPLALSDVDLAEAVKAAVAQVSEPLRASGSALDVDVRGPIVGHWDASRLQQVTVNLLSNAIKYGEGRPIEVRADAEGDRARIVVRDHGIGIAPELLPHIFGRFERAGTTRNYGGLGLGLYLVQRIVERLGGTVECASIPHEGSTFAVTLPLGGSVGEAPHRA